MNPSPEPGMCACGRPLHYADLEVQAYVERMCAVLGPILPVWLRGVAYLVPRHYIALHGLKAVELPTLGFPSVTMAEAAKWGESFERLRRVN